MSGRRVPIAERFEKYVDKSGDCWLWTGGVSSGYGRIKEDAPSRQQLCAHRVAYELANGPIPRGLVIDHLCHVTLCVNPAHLRAVTSKQNNENRAGANSISKSGYLGVFEYYPGCWKGKVKHHARDYYTARFDTPEEANEAVKVLRSRLFTHNDHDRARAA